jgi:hypothetical protein
MNSYKENSMNEVKSVTLIQKLRPIKLLFLVSQNDRETVKKIITFNTTLWGGLFNPIVPIEQDEKSLMDIIEGSNSDFVVNVTSETFLPRNIERSRLIYFEGYDGLIDKTKNDDSYLNYGCDIRPLLKDYWEKEGRFDSSTLSNKSAKARSAFYVEGEDELWNNYALLEYGHYPEDHKYNYKDRFCQATNAENFKLNEDSLLGISKLEALSPLNFTLSKVNYYFLSNTQYFLGDFLIYLGNPNSVEDWLAYWNLRCFSLDSIFIPWDKTDLFSEHIKSFAKKSEIYQDKRAGQSVLFQKGISLSRDDFKFVVERTKGIVQGPRTIRDFIPSFGNYHLQNEDGSYGPAPRAAPIGLAYQQEDIAYLNDQKLEFKAALPEFLRGYENQMGWAISISGWLSQDSKFHLRIPKLGAIDDYLHKNFFFFKKFRISPNENIVIYNKGEYSSLGVIRLNLPSDLDIFKGILSGYEVKLLDYSEKGKFSSSIEMAAGGIWGGAGILQDRGVQAVLLRLSSQNKDVHLPRIEIEKMIRENSQSLGDKIPLNEQVTPSRILDVLIARKILRPGLEFKCNNCYRQGWYHITEFADMYKCQYCHTNQETPIIDQKEWRFRSTGLFSSKGVGYGSLPVVCTAISVSMEFHDAKFIYSCNIELPDGKPKEIDLIFLNTRYDDPPEIMICECKSSNFEEKDFQGIKSLAKIMKGAVFCISTLKESFSENEINWVKELRNSGIRIATLARAEIEAKGYKGLRDTIDPNGHIMDFSSLAEKSYNKYIVKNVEASN